MAPNKNSAEDTANSSNYVDLIKSVTGEDRVKALIKFAKEHEIEGETKVPSPSPSPIPIP